MRVCAEVSSPRARTAVTSSSRREWTICSRRWSTASWPSGSTCEASPSPDTFLAGPEALGVRPAEAAIFEDALAGVAAGRAGRFGFVVGVNRSDQAEALLGKGADVVVSDLAELLEDA